MMAQRNRLRDLQMGHAGHDRRCMLLGAVEDDGLQRIDRPQHFVDRAAHEQLEIGRYLVVARPRRVQPTRRRPDPLGEIMLDVHVNVFERWILGHAVPRIGGPDRRQPAVDRRRIVAPDDPLRAEHRGMGAARHNVLAPNPLVGGDRAIYLAHEFGRTA